MSRMLSCIIVALSLSLAPAAADAVVEKDASHPTVRSKKAPAPKHRTTRKRHDYGFLPGYRPPEVIARQRAVRYWRSGPHFYGPAAPSFYYGRWNGGGFGPCYANTPIGYVWTCGR